MKILLLPAFILLFSITRAQTKDTLAVEEVRVKAYFSEQSIKTLPASVSVIDLQTLQNQAPFSLVGAVNSAPGVRMEERSPASYRLSIRGSVLRSPFGVRNVKVYMDDFSLTDAGGNTYLNLLDAGSVSGIELIKGPEGSIYGANTGGVMLLQSFQKPDSLFIGATLSAASNNTFLQRFSFQQKEEKYQIAIQQGVVKSNGYREHSNSERKYLQLVPRFNYAPKAELKALLLFSDLQYETPGGITQEQFDINPRSARAQAVSQQAEIFNKTLFGGVSHEFKLSNHLRHVIAVSASATDFKNPFVTNFELRNENSESIRTFIEWRNDQLFPLKIQTGYEGQQTKSCVQNFVNNAGVQGSSQREMDLKANLGLAFLHLSFIPSPRLNVETALSFNKFSYKYHPIFPNEQAVQKRNFKAQLMPRSALSYQLLKGLALRTSISRGFSTPTLEEVNPSGTSLNNLLQAENGWNKEIGFRAMGLLGRGLYWDVVYFNYQLKNAIVRGVNPNETDYYINAGSTQQNGLESEFSWQILSSRQHGLLRSLVLKNSSTLYKFRFANYINGSSDYSGNKLTGVPQKTIITSLQTAHPFNTSFFIQYNYTSALPLNDANTAFAKSYHLVNAKLTWRNKIGRLPVSIFTGTDNLLNEKYSLGNDLNALGNRFFNPAATRNYFCGLSFGY